MAKGILDFCENFCKIFLFVFTASSKRYCACCIGTNKGPFANSAHDENASVGIFDNKALGLKIMLNSCNHTYPQLVPASVLQILYQHLNILSSHSHDAIEIIRCIFEPVHAYFVKRSLAD